MAKDLGLRVRLGPREDLHWDAWQPLRLTLVQAMDKTVRRERSQYSLHQGGRAQRLSCSKCDRSRR